MFKPLTPPKTTKLQQLLFLMLIVFTIFLLLFRFELIAELEQKQDILVPFLLLDF